MDLWKIGKFHAPCVQYNTGLNNPDNYWTISISLISLNRDAKALFKLVKIGGWVRESLLIRSNPIHYIRPSGFEPPSTTQIGTKKPIAYSSVRKSVIKIPIRTVQYYQEIKKKEEEEK